MTKKLVVITGASSGIGAAIAQVFAAESYPLALLGRNLVAMQALNLQNVLCLAVDVTDQAAVKAAVVQAESRFGDVEGLINNAGVAIGGDFTEVSHADHEAMVKVNLLGAINCLEVVLPTMQSNKAGTIINMSSVADRSARPALATYAATKAALKSLSESLRVANAKYDIRVCNFAPARVATPMLAAAHIQTGQQLAPEDVAKAVLWVYQQPQTLCIRDILLAPTSFEG